jgi:hypothetical protein
VVPRTRGKSVVLLGPWNNFANGQNVRQFQIQFSHCEIQHGFTSTVGRKLRADLESGLDSFGAIGATVQRTSQVLTSGLPRLVQRQGASVPRVTGLFDEVIDPVQSREADEDQVDSHCEAHDPRRDHQEHSRGQGSDRQ